MAEVLQWSMGARTQLGRAGSGSCPLERPPGGPGGLSRWDGGLQQAAGPCAPPARRPPLASACQRRRRCLPHTPALLRHAPLLSSTPTPRRAGSAADMRQLTASLMDAREGTGEVRSVLLHASFRPRLPGLTKLVSKLSKEGGWRKALEVFEAVEEMG